MENDYLEQLHKKSINNKNDFEKNKDCGCFYCKRIFESKKINRWIDGKTAICPYCSVDAVIPNSDDCLITAELLEEMNKKWF